MIWRIKPNKRYIKFANKLLVSGFCKGCITFFATRYNSNTVRYVEFRRRGQYACKNKSKMAGKKLTAASRLVRKSNYLPVGASKIIKIIYKENTR